jgi:hypothetical protein
MAEAKPMGARWWLAVAVPAFFILWLVAVLLMGINTNRRRVELRDEIRGLTPGYTVLVDDKRATNPAAFVEALLHFRDYSPSKSAPDIRDDQWVVITDGTRRITLRLARNWRVPDEYVVWVSSGEEVALVSTADLQAAGIQ